MDVFSPAKRSEIMRRVQSTGTTPELLVRRLVSGLGYRYRLNSEKLRVIPTWSKSTQEHTELMSSRSGLQTSP